MCRPSATMDKIGEMLFQRRGNARVLERAAGFNRDDTVEARLGKLRALLAPGSRDDDDIALLGELLLLPSTAADLNLSPQRKREKLFEALISQLEAEVQHRPVLMVSAGAAG